MISLAYTVHCDECATQQPLVAQKLTEARSEASNLGWTAEKMETGAQQWYCPDCAVSKLQQA